jgi:hypothetical protein
VESDHAREETRRSSVRGRSPQPAKLGASLVEPAEMRQRDDFHPHRYDRTRLVVQGAVGPFDRLFKVPRGE